jgi:predicted alpha/beta hydrolase family esterase
MAALLWRRVLAGELLVAAATAWLWNALAHISALEALLVACGAFIALQLLWVLAAQLAAGFSSRRRWNLADTHHLLRALLSEPVYFGLAQFAMSADARARVLPIDAGSTAGGARPVLLIHGILCNRAIWAPLRARLRVAGFAPVRALNLEPLSGDMETYRASVEQELRALHQQSRGAPVAIVAHSMGGLVARALLRSADPRLIRRIVTVASPHHGTTLALCLPLPAARQMRTDDPWLQKLNVEQEGQFASPTTTICSREDGLVTPASSAVLKGAEVREMRGLGHFGLLRSRRALDSIVGALGRD